MNRTAALILTTALLGTGCIVEDDDDFRDDSGSVLVYWDFVRNAPAQPRGSVLYDPYDVGGTKPSGLCAQSDVDTVEVRTPEGSFSFDCVFEGVQGAELIGMPLGTYDYTIIGWRGNVQAYRSTVALHVDRHLPTHGIDVEPVRAPVDVAAWFAYGAGANDYYRTCNEASNPDVTFKVWDSYGTLVVHDAAGCPPGARADPLPVFQDYLDLDGYEIELEGRDAQGALIFASCAWSFDHFDELADPALVDVTLDTNPVPTCL